MYLEKKEITMPSDFTVIQSVRQHFGNEANAFVDVEPQVLFVGSSKDFTFNCPNIDPNADAVLMFQSLGVDHNRNILRLNSLQFSADGL